jgi:hypothetical protein
MMATNVIEIYRAPVALPAEIKALKGWVLWKLEQHPGERKPRKVPYYIDGRRRQGAQGSEADREALATFDRACLACSKGGWSGIGLATLPEFGVVAVDWDSVITDGDLHPEVAALVATTYSEISPSGRGVRAFFTGTVPGNRKDNAGSPQVEFFTSRGFVTVTGVVTPVCEMLGLEETIDHVTPEINALFIARFGATRTAPAAREDIDARQVREMLDKMDPDPAHDVWFRVGLGLHHQFGAEGFQLWNEWSARGKGYPGERVLQQRWRSIRNDDANPVTIGTVRQYARDAGWQEDYSSEFSPIVVEDGAPAAAPFPSMTRDKQGRIEVTVDNLNKALRHVGIAGMTLGFDAFRDEIMFSLDAGTNWAPFKDTDYITLHVRLERTGFKTISDDRLRKVVARVAEDNRFDSAQQWLGALRWDGTPRVDTFFSRYFKATDTTYVRAVSAYTWTAMAGRVLDPGCQADMVPVLVGDQGLRKSTGVKAMAPAVEFFCEISLGDKEDDLSRKMRGTLIAEIGELRGLHSKEIEHIKQFVTRTHEVWTPKFKEFKTSFARRLVFIGTTNQSEFLADETGNRRWLPLEVNGVGVEAIAADRAQLWAEARDRFLLDGVAWSDAERLGRDQHQGHMISDSWEPIIRQWLDQVGADGLKNSARSFLRLHDVMQMALNIDVKHFARRDELRVGRVLRAIGYESKVVRDGQGMFKAWMQKVPF